MIRLHFLGANRQVTGSRYMVETSRHRVMIDCGLFQERAWLDRNWDPPVIDPDRLDALLLTHAHLDHCGLLPRFVRDGFAGPVHATEPSVDLARLVMEDSGRIQEEDAAYKAKRHAREGRRGPHPEVPLYTAEDARRVAPLFRPVGLGEPVDVAPGITAVWQEAGHILGAGSIRLRVEDEGASRTILFSGDIGGRGQALMKDPADAGTADCVVMESTYGGRFHRDEGDIRARLASVIHDTLARGGNLLIPTFAIDRAQDLLFYLSDLVNDERIPRTTIFLDSPMAVSATTIYREYAHLLDAGTQALLEAGRHPFQFEGLHFVRSAQESKAINSIRGSCIIMAGSGMCTGGRIKHHLKQNIERPESTVLFVGYQAPGTLGRQIRDGAPRVRIHGRQFDVRARVEHVECLSAHADHAGLLEWIATLSAAPRRIFLTHGELAPAQHIARDITARHGWPVEVPEYRTSVDLD